VQLADPINRQLNRYFYFTSLSDSTPTYNCTELVDEEKQDQRTVDAYLSAIKGQHGPPFFSNGSLAIFHNPERRVVVYFQVRSHYIRITTKIQKDPQPSRQTLALEAKADSNLILRPDCWTF